MKIRAKSSILLVITGLLIISGIVSFHYYEKGRMSTLFQNEKKDKEATFDKVLNLKSGTLATFVYDYTYWDEMVKFVSSKDEGWAYQNIDVSLPVYAINAVWVYAMDNTLVHVITWPSKGIFKEIPLPKEAFSKVFSQSYYCHFFMKTDQGLLEVRGSTIQPTADAERKTPPQGYFFAARVWDAAYLDDLSKLIGGTVKFTSASEALQPGAALRPEEGTIAFSRTLTGWDDTAIGNVAVTIESATIKDFSTLFKRAFIVTAVSIIISSVIILLFILQLVHRPLKFVSKTLRSENPIYIESLEKRKDEFGDIAGLIHKFFQQKTKLVEEIEERKKVEEKLTKAYADLNFAQQELIQSEKMAALGRFSTGVAHEVRNPLGIILSGIEFLELKLSKADPHILSAVEKIKESVMRANSVLQSLLLYAKPSQMKVEITEPNELMSEVLSLVKYRFSLTNIDVETDLSKEPLYVEVDRNQIYQVLLNIMTNSVEAMPDGGKIVIKTYKKVIPDLSPEVPACVIEVIDTGHGISREHMSQLGEPFFSTKESKKGTGLGLFIVKTILDSHKGKLIIHSEEGKGTSIKVVLPLQQV